VIGIKKKPDTGQKKTCYTTEIFFGVQKTTIDCEVADAENMEHLRKCLSVPARNGCGYNPSLKQCQKSDFSAEK
jgi:hypothetical protein